MQQLYLISENVLVTMQWAGYTFCGYVLQTFFSNSFCKLLHFVAKHLDVKKKLLVSYVQ